VQAALVEGEGTLGVLRRLVLNLEQAAWDAVTEDATWLDVSTDQIGQAYAEAVKWADAVVPV
jgi:c-di-GMP-related signal transduction protein